MAGGPQTSLCTPWGACICPWGPVLGTAPGPLAPTPQGGRKTERRGSRGLGQGRGGSHGFLPKAGPAVSASGSPPAVLVGDGPLLPAAQGPVWEAGSYGQPTATVTATLFPDFRALILHPHPSPGPGGLGPGLLPVPPAPRGASPRPVPFLCLPSGSSPRPSVLSPTQDGPHASHPVCPGCVRPQIQVLHHNPWQSSVWRWAPRGVGVGVRRGRGHRTPGRSGTL